MLRPLRQTRQIPGELPRRWYFGAELDLVVWFAADGRPHSFQLAYDRHHDEHSIAWHPQRGYRHFRVDDSRGGGLLAATPVLYADGPFDGDSVLRRFLAAAGEMPPELVEFIAARLREFDGQANLPRRPPD